MKKLYLIVPILFITSCATLAEMSERAFGKDCEVQVALADESVTSAFEAVVIGVEEGYVKKSTAQSYVLKITELREVLKIAGSKCPLDEDAALTMVESVRNDATTLKGGLNGL